MSYLPTFTSAVGSPTVACQSRVSRVPEGPRAIGHAPCDMKIGGCGQSSYRFSQSGHPGQCTAGQFKAKYWLTRNRRLFCLCVLFQGKKCQIRQLVWKLQWTVGFVDVNSSSNNKNQKTTTTKGKTCLNRFIRTSARNIDAAQDKKKSRRVCGSAIKSLEVQADRTPFSFKNWNTAWNRWHLQN